MQTFCFIFAVYFKKKTNLVQRQSLSKVGRRYNTKFVYNRNVQCVYSVSDIIMSDTQSNILSIYSDLDKPKGE